MNEFQYYMFHASKDREYTPFEECIYKLLESIVTLSKQYDLTIQFYLNSSKEEIGLLEENYQKELPNIKARYEEEYKHAEGSESDKDLIAAHLSGIDEFDENYYESKANIKLKYSEYYDLYSKTQIVSLYSLLEKSIKDVCEIFQEEYSKSIGITDLKSSNYIEGFIKYLTLVIELNTEAITPLYNELEDYQLVRNKIIHHLSEFTELKKIKDIINKNSDSLKLIRQNNSNYLFFNSHTFFDKFAQLIRDIVYELVIATEIKSENTFAFRGLKHLFQILDDKIIIENLVMERPTRNKIKYELDFKSKKKKVASGKCRITIEGSVNQSLKITNQLDREPINEFCSFISVHNYMFQTFVFKFLRIKKAQNNIKIMLYE